MAPSKNRSKAELARRALIGGSQDDSGDDDALQLSWQWIHEGSSDDQSSSTPSSKTRKRKASSNQGTQDGRIIGARKGDFQCMLGDTVLLKAANNETWVGLIQDFYQEEDEADMMARFLWFNRPQDLGNKSKRRTDAFPHEIYISTATDNNSLECISGAATVLSHTAFLKLHPSGTIKRSSRDYGRTFVCRRGINARTITYTEEFDWHEVYSSPEELPTLIDLVDSQTKASRKISRKPKKEPSQHKDLDYAVAADEENGEPKTPRKRRKLNDIGTPTSTRKAGTPRKFLTPTHKRIVVKKPLEFTPLGTRVLSPSAISSPFQIARNQLHVSSVPASLPCREEEFSTVYSHLDAAITDGSGSCIYISGTPGTGKTATVREVVAQLSAAVLAEELDDFIFVEINGMKVTDPHQSYSLLWEALKGDRVSPAHALELLEREFSSPSPRRVPCVVLMDELDQLVTKNQSVMYNFFNWPSLRHSRLIVLAVANTMDLPERTLSNKISSRLGLTRITFPGYTHDQLMQIIQSRLEGVPGNIVHPDAIQFAARKVAAVSGDARRALDICRRAVEIAEASELEQSKDVATGESSDAEDSAPATPSKTNRRKDLKTQPLRTQQLGHGADRPEKKKVTVTIATIKQAINEATSSPLQLYLRALPLSSKLFLAALLARIRRTGLGEALLGEVLDEAKRLGLMAQLKPVEKYLLHDDNAFVEGQPKEKKGLDQRETRQLLESQISRARGMGAAAIELAEAGIVGLESRRGERVGRVRLGVGDEEIRLALKDDDEVKGLGFQS